MNTLVKRPLGRTGEKLSVIGFGGIAVMNMDPEKAAETVEKAVGLGVNYFDVAPAYGNAEEILGPALEAYRADVFLACKTNAGKAGPAWKDLENSLARLRTDYFDLYQFHGICSLDKAKEITATGGALETMIKARAEGIIRNVGFSAHSEDAALWIMDKFDFDSVLFPLNVHCWNQARIGVRLVAEAERRNVGILALKSLAKRPWKDEKERKLWPKCWYRPVDRKDDVEAQLAFTLSKPVTAAVSPGYAELLFLACDSALKIQESDFKSEKPLPAGKPIFS